MNHPTHEPAREGFVYLELFVLGAIWGGSFLFMRVAAPQFGAAPLVDRTPGAKVLVMANRDLLDDTAAPTLHAC